MPNTLTRIAAPPPLSDSRASALSANIADMNADLRDRCSNVTDAECDAVLASLRHVRLAASLFASAIDAERKALRDVIRCDRDGRPQDMPADVMDECTLELVGDMLALNSDAAAVLGSL